MFSAIIIAEILPSCIWCWNCTGLLGSFAVLNKICNNSFFQPSLFPSVLVEQCNNFWQKTKYKYTSSMNNTKQSFEFYTLSDGIRPSFLETRFSLANKNMFIWDCLSLKHISIICVMKFLNNNESKHQICIPPLTKSEQVHDLNGFVMHCIMVCKARLIAIQLIRKTKSVQWTSSLSGHVDNLLWLVSRAGQTFRNLVFVDKKTQAPPLSSE